MKEPRFVSDDGRPAVPFSVAEDRQLHAVIDGTSKARARATPTDLPPDINFRKWYAAFILLERV